MQQVSNNYINAINQLTRQTGSKVVINGVTYIDELISHPFISINSNSLIGGFPSKSVTFEMYSVENLSIADKEISVYRGLLTDNGMEYVLQGIFTAKASDVVLNESGNKITVTAYDRALLFDVPQNSRPELTDSFTYGDYINYIIEDVHVPLKNEDYPLKDTIMLQLPDLDGGMTKRTLLSKFAEIIGCICVIDRDGCLLFSRQSKTDYTVSDYYGRFLISEGISTVNQIAVTTQANLTDVVLYPENIENPNVYKIVDNPFCLPTQNDVIQLAADSIIGLITADFTVEEIVDDYIIDINDIVNVNGYELPVLSYNSTGRIKATIETKIDKTTSSALANSLSSRVTSVETNLNQALNEQIPAIKEFNELISSSLGLYTTYVTQSNGSTIAYMHDQKELNESTVIFTMTAGGIAWTNQGWNNGSPIWSYGASSAGDALFHKLAAEGISIGNSSEDYSVEVTPKAFQIYYKNTLVTEIIGDEMSVPRLTVSNYADVGAIRLAPHHDEKGVLDGSDLIFLV